MANKTHFAGPVSILNKYAIILIFLYFDFIEKLKINLLNGKLLYLIFCFMRKLCNVP